MIKYRQPILLFVLLVCGLLANSQDTAKMENRQVYLPIVRKQVFTNSSDSVIIVYGYHKQIPVEQLQPIRAMHSYMDTVGSDTVPRKMFKEIGSGFVIKTDTLTMGFIKLYNKQDSLTIWDDYISINLPVPVLEHRSIFSDLAFNATLFTNYNKDLLYSQPEIIFRDNKKLEDSIYRNILADLKNGYEKLKDRTDLSAIWYKKIPEGRFKNKVPLEVLRDAGKKEVESFLMYAASYPVGYTSTLYRFIESFIGWATSNSPYSYMEIKNNLFPIYKNKEELRRRLPEYKTDIIKEDATKIMIGDVIKLSNQSRFKEAEALSDFTINLALETKDTSALPWTYIGMAQVQQDQNKYVTAIDFCEKAMLAGQKSGDKEIEIQAAVKKGFCLFKMTKYKEADAFLLSVLKKIKAYQPTLADNIVNNYSSKAYEYLVQIQKVSGNYLQSLKYLDSLIYFNQIGNTLDAQLKSADSYKIKGEILNGQGKPADALEAFKRAVEIYSNNLEIVKLSNARNEVANCYFKLGNYKQSIEDARKSSIKLIEKGDYNNAGYSFSIMGQSFWNLSQYDSAVISHKQAIEYRKKGKDTSNIAWSWQQLGELYGLSGQKKLSLAAYDSSAFYYSSIKDSTGLGEVYNMKGNVFLNDESYKYAIELFEKAKGITTKTTVDGLFNLGNAWYAVDTAKSRHYFEECRKLSISTGNISQEFYSSLNLAELAYKNRDYAWGKQYHEECIKLSSEIKTGEILAHCIALQGNYFESKVMLDSALLYYDSSATMFSHVNKSKEISKRLSVAWVQISKGEFVKAEKVILYAIKQADSASLQLSHGEALATCAFLYGRTGEFSKGLRNSDIADSIFRATGFNIRLANTYVAKGALLSSMGEYKKAILTYLVADSVFKEELVNDQRGVVYNNIGIVYSNQKDYSSSLKNLDISLNMLPKGQISENYLLTQGNRAECLFYLKRINESEKLLLDILPKARELKLHRVASGMAITLGTLYYEQAKPEKAIEYFNYALEYSLSSGEVEKSIEAMKYLALINEKNNKNDDAEKLFRQSIALVEKFKTGIGWESYYEFGMHYNNHHQPDSAVKYFKKAIELLEKNMENVYGGEEAKKLFDNDPRKADLYNKITFLLFSLGKTDEAWVYANRYNIAGIKELAGSLSLSSSEKEKNEALKKLFAMQQEQKALRETAQKETGEARIETLKKIEILENDYNNFVQDMAAKYDDLGTYFSRTNADEFYNYKSKLPGDAAVLLYMQNGKTLMIFSLTKEKLAVDTMTVEIAELVNEFIASIKNAKENTGTGPLAVRSEPVDEKNEHSGKDFRELSVQLYNILIGSVNENIKSKKRLCIIPTGVYSNLPFQCLGKTTSEKRFHFLMEDYTIFYTNKMSVFNDDQSPEQAKTNFTSFAAFGVPDATLRYNIEEVKTLSKLVGIDSTVYTDSRATESMAKQSLLQKKIIHFATHGVLNYSSDYSQSYLKLLPDADSSAGNNGKLTLREIQGLGIKNCNMVILSACQTAVSKELVKGWNISPANSFLISNVKSVVASFWKVADEPTSLLMEYFYENLLKKMEKAEALRQAQIKLSQNPRFVHPNYWGAFALYGDWR